MRESPMYQEILEEGKQEGRQEGIQVGMERGKQEEKERIARNLLFLGMTIEQVATATGLSIEQINSLT